MEAIGLCVTGHLFPSPNLKESWNQQQITAILGQVALKTCCLACFHKNPMFRGTDKDTCQVHTSLVSLEDLPLISSDWAMRSPT